MNVDTNFLFFYFDFDSLKDVPLHDCLHFTVGLFISLRVLFFAELCVILRIKVGFQNALYT